MSEPISRAEFARAQELQRETSTKLFDKLDEIKDIVHENHAEQVRLTGKIESFAEHEVRCDAELEDQKKKSLCCQKKLTSRQEGSVKNSVNSKIETGDSSLESSFMPAVSGRGSARLLPRFWERLINKFG